MGLHDILLASRDTASRESTATKFDEKELCKSIVKTYRRKSGTKIVDTSQDDKENLFDLKHSLKMVRRSL